MLPCLLASPTAVAIAGTPYLARPLTLGGFASLLRNGADALGLDGDAGELPEFGDPAFQRWLESAGVPLLLWECLRRDEPGLTFARCVTLAASADAGALIGPALRRARSAMPGEGRGKDVTRLDWAAAIYRRYEESGALPPAIAELSLDQLWLLASGGKGFDPPDDSRAVLDEMQRLHEEKWAGRPGDVPTTVEDDLATMGLSIVPEGVPDGER